ncbi:hypothetical protein H6G14_29890 [Nostoc parmelioides FACHB-3921]|uniref:Uncharacterized protein n=1 Tax=Nostoc parmelioides FACHB-3921 TaxID=2692909 RepID=A0ABR8BNS7_9NOSO|nr:hypothetical protein [Nostoc parmelioides]MBD2255425.1 hypothetical protein [Nostoc parmelioides FACHB-3921]
MRAAAPSSEGRSSIHQVEDAGASVQCVSAQRLARRMHLRWNGTKLS